MLNDLIQGLGAAVVVEATALAAPIGASGAVRYICVGERSAWKESTPISLGACRLFPVSWSGLQRVLYSPLFAATGYWLLSLSRASKNVPNIGVPVGHRPEARPGVKVYSSQAVGFELIHQAGR